MREENAGPHRPGRTRSLDMRQPDPPSSPDQALSRLLAEWRVNTLPPDDFHNRVRLRLRQLPATEGRGLTSAMGDWLNDVFLRPAWSLGYAVVLLAAGLVGGYLGAREQTARWDRQMEQRYVQSVDPYFLPR
jgi:hypothetical protein